MASHAEALGEQVMTGVTGGSDEGRCVLLGTLSLDLGVPEMQGHTQQCVVGNCNCTRDHNALRERRAATNGDASDTHALRCVAG